MSRQQRRKFERELMKLAGDVCRDGLPFPHRPEATMALALAVREELADTRHVLRASRAAALVNRVFDATLRRLPPGYGGQALACKAGCAYCCHTVVMATAPEIFLLASELETRHDRAFSAEVVGRCEAISRLGAGAHGRMRPCPLLHDNLCSAYAARPTVCRKHTSFSVAACLAEYEGRGGKIPIRRFDQEVFECCAVALITGLRLWDERPCAVFELSGALRIALQDEGAEEKWLAGEDVFGSVQSQAKLPGIEEHAAFIWQRFAGAPA